MMAANKLTGLQRKIVPKRIYQLICAGFNQPKVIEIIKEEFSVEMTQQNVSYYFNRYARREDEKTEDQRRKALGRYDWGMSEAANAWERSKTERRSTAEKAVKLKGKKNKKKGKTGVTTRLESSEKIEELFGDPRYLAEHRQYSDMHDRITGIRAPEKQQHEHKGKVIILPDNKRGDRD